MLSGAKPVEELDACITMLLDRCENYHDTDLESNKNILRPVLIELIQFVQQFFPVIAKEKGLTEQLLDEKPKKVILIKSLLSKSQKVNSQHRSNVY